MDVTHWSSWVDNTQIYINYKWCLLQMSSTPDHKQDIFILYTHGGTSLTLHTWLMHGNISYVQSQL
jgi:hypothetical protein